MYPKRLVSFLLVLIAFNFITYNLSAQVSAVPFLLYAPDDRTAAMGDAGTALSPDANSLSSNPSKLAFIRQHYGFAISYNPWLKSLDAGMNLSYLSSFYKVGERNTVGASIRYFSMGKVHLFDASQQDLGIYSPNEFAIDATFARKYGMNFSIATSLRYIHSNIATGQVIAGREIQAGTAFAADISAYFEQGTYILGTDAVIAAGLNISNIGTKMSYTNGTNAYFLPANLKIGAATTFLFAHNSQVSLALDVNKLLVPKVNNPVNAAENISVPQGIFGSFMDAPGGFKEELAELNVGSGVEYLYKQQFALRGGYSYTHPRQGNRSFFTAGVGFKYEMLGLDIAYMMAGQDKSPLGNTLRFTLLFNFNSSSQ
jgi:hypothetical protein